MKKNDHGFVSELDAAVKMKPKSGAVWLLLSIVGLFIFLIGYASIAEIDERTRGSGQVMPSQDIQTIQSLEGGVITDIMVREGDVVKKGQILMRIDDVLFASEEGGLEVRLASLQAKQARLSAEVKGEKPSFPPVLIENADTLVQNELQLYTSRQTELQTALERIEDEEREARSNINEIKASINKFSQSRALLKKELDIAKRLVASNAMPEIEQIRLERQYAEVSGDLQTAIEAKTSMEAKLSGIEKKAEEKMAAYQSEALGQLNEVETQIRAIEEGLKSAGDRVARTELRAPVNGIVQRLALKTIGGVVEPAQRLIEIVPLEDDLLIRAKVAPSDVAFLRPGQEVKVSITAYDPQIYGRLDGTLERISADTIEEQDGSVFFEVDVRTNKNYLGSAENPLRITTGMIANIEVITGRRTVLTYILKPILRAKQNALGER